MDIIKWLLFDKLLKVRQASTRAINLNRFQGFLKSLDLSRTRENYEELVKLKQLQVKFFYKQQSIMEISERMIYLIHRCEDELEQLNSVESDDLSKRYLSICCDNQELIASFVRNYELAAEDYKLVSNKINLVLKDAVVLLFNSILSEQEYLLTKSYLTKIKIRFNNQLALLEDSYKAFLPFNRRFKHRLLNNNKIKSNKFRNDINNNQGDESDN